MTPQMVQQVIEACRQHGVDFVVAPYEADAQLAYLKKINMVDAVITEDSDLMVRDSNFDIVLGPFFTRFSSGATPCGRIACSSWCTVLMGCGLVLAIRWDAQFIYSWR